MNAVSLKTSYCTALTFSLTGSTLWLLLGMFKLPTSPLLCSGGITQYTKGDLNTGPGRPQQSDNWDGQWREAQTVWRGWAKGRVRSRVGQSRTAWDSTTQFRTVHDLKLIHLYFWNFPFNMLGQEQPWKVKWKTRRDDYGSAVLVIVINNHRAPLSNRSLNCISTTGL